ncbi:MAG: threonine--tRNA ligase [Anaerovoracaceae bacterium]|nr:threonine--tRNA ligase [Bacillota bacterium]MDY2671236.1 threonine--tRNA ligase [Anaerovoracaceae bacterium]
MDENKYTFENEEYRRAYWNTCSRVMAQAVKRLWPEAKLADGGADDEGWHYDIFTADTVTADDLEKIEAEMKKICKERIQTEDLELSKADALEIMKDEPFKQELINDMPEGAAVKFCRQGDFTDMLEGPHLNSTGRVKANAFRLNDSSASYWKGDAKRESLQRIYGIAFPKKDELEEWLERQEEARRRDHRRIGKEMRLFMTDDLVGRGLPMFLPRGYTIWRELENYIRDKEIRNGYQHVLTPCIGTVNLYKTSGHWDHYKDNMFPEMVVDDESYVLRPMNCPHHMMIYASRPRSYRDLPLRIGEIAHDFRYEASGTLKGIERGRHFCQNDAHLFVTPEQIKDEISNVCDMILDTYKDFGITDYRCVLSLRDPDDKEKYHDDDEMWNKAESALREVLRELNIDFTEEIGEAAFYGPKLDVNVQPAVGAEYTLSTCQLDFCLPAKFDLKYIDADGKEQQPVVLHRAILGSLDRFMAYLIEETMGNFPTWLAPVQAKILTVTDSAAYFAESVRSMLENAGVRAEIDGRNETIGKKIRESTMEKDAYMLVVGERDVENNTVSVRTRAGEDLGAMSPEDFREKIIEEIRTHAR